MGKLRGGIAAVLGVLVVGLLAFGTAYHAIAQEDPPDCSTQGDGSGAGGGSGGTGGGMCGGGGHGGSTGGSPGQTGQPSNEDPGNTAGGGGTGGDGNGSDGSAGSNNIRTPTPPPPPPGVPGNTGGTSSSATTPAPSANATAQVANLAKKYSTGPDEVSKWFGRVNPNDSVAGEAQSIVVKPGDQVTVFAGDRVEQGDGSVLRTGIEGVGDTSPKGGETVDITLHSNPVVLGSTVTEPGGRFAATVRIPPNTEVGRHFIVALAPNTHNGRAAFIYPLTVSTEDQAAGPVAVENVGTTGGESKRFPWLLVEILIGSASVIALFVARVRRAAAAGS